jgi:hypothetical protein
MGRKLLRMIESETQLTPCHQNARSRVLAAGQEQLPAGMTFTHHCAAYYVHAALGNFEASSR